MTSCERVPTARQTTLPLESQSQSRWQLLPVHVSECRTGDGEREPEDEPKDEPEEEDEEEDEDEDEDEEDERPLPLG